jgi:hypothetical protein
MARLTILLVALVAALANAFVPVPVVHTGKSIFPEEGVAVELLFQ